MNSNALRPDRTAGGTLAGHPLFPGICALWIATVLTIMAMAIPASLLERAAATVHLDALIPAARPPLGFTARLLLAFALALGGGAAGWLAGLVLRRRAAAPAPAMRARTVQPGAPGEATAPAPAPADDDEDFARLAAARGGPASRRRALTSETAEAPSILEISAIPALEPLSAAPAKAAPAPASAPTAPETTASEPPAGPRQSLIRDLAELGAEATARLCAAPLESLGVVQLAERFALALQARRLRARTGPGPGAPDGEPAQPGLEPGPAPFAEPRAEGQGPAPTAAGRPFDMPVEDAPPSPLATRRPLPQAPAAAAPIDPAAEVARWALPELADEGEDIDEEQLPDPAAAPTYSSLTDIRPATRVPPPLADFVRIEAGDETPLAEAGPQPVVVFPGQAVPAPPLSTRLPGIDGPASARDTEAALREALSALQRMSGAA